MEGLFITLVLLDFHTEVKKTPPSDVTYWTSYVQNTLLTKQIRNSLQVNIKYSQMNPMKDVSW
jgi:hypothetical protein